MILIIGSAEEYHAMYMHEYLKNKGEKVKYLDSRAIPGCFISSWYTDKAKMEGYFLIDGEKISFDSIKSIYWRWYYGINIYPKSNSHDDVFNAQMVEREFTSFVISMFESLDCKWVNSNKAIEMHKNKPYQLHLMGENGIRIPKTLITTDKDEVIKFAEELNKDIIFKPVRGGAHTQALTDEDLKPEKLEMLKYSPVTFQEKLKGVDIRVYGIGSEIFSAEIRTNALDFRDDPEAEIVPVKMPENIQNDCLKIMELLDLKFTGIDIRYNPDTKEYIFIEANPSPMFLHFEQKSGFPITEKLYRLLAS